MTVEIIVHFDGTKSSIAFDALPTFNTLRRAITSDITDGNPSFLVIGSTQRGTPIVISDQTSFLRALGARTSMIVSVRLQPAEGEHVNVSPSTSTVSNEKPPLHHQHDSSVDKQQKQKQHQYHSDPSPSAAPVTIQNNNHHNNSNNNNNNNNNNNALVAAAVSPTRHDQIVGQQQSPFQEGIASCQQIVETAGDARCCTFVVSEKGKSQKIWVGERQSGNIRIHDYFSGEVDRIIKPKSSFQVGPHSGCLCISFVPGFQKAENNSVVDRVWAGFNSKDIRVYAIGPSGRETMVHQMTEHSAAVTCIESTAGGAYCFSASLDFTIIQWNVNSMTVSRIFSRHRNGVRALLWSAAAAVAANTPVLFSAADDRCLVAWDSNSGEVIAEGTHLHGSGIHALGVDCDGRVWTGCEDGSVKVWELKRLMEPIANTSAVVSPRFRNDPKKTNNKNGATTSNNEYDTASAPSMMTMRFECCASFREHAAGVTFIKCLKSRALTSAHDGTIAVYDTDKLEVLGDLPHPHDAPAVSLVLSSFTTVFKFWTGSSDKKLCRWTIEDPAGNGGGSQDSSSDVNQIQKLFGLGLLGQHQQNNNRNHNNNIKSEDDHAISLLRFTLDRTTEKTLIVAEEAKNRAELELFFERRLRQKYFAPQQSTLFKFSEAVLEAHHSMSRSLIETHIGSCLATQAALESTSSALAYASNEMHSLHSQRSEAQQQSAQTERQATEHVSFLNKRVRELESSLAFARGEVARSSQEERENSDREQHLQEAYDKAIERQKELENELKKMRESKSSGDHAREKGQMLRDEQWRQQEFILQGHIAEQKNVIEERDSQIRMLKMQLSSQQQLAQARENEIKSLAKSNESNRSVSEKAAADERQRWVDRTSTLEQQLERVLAESKESQTTLESENSELRMKLKKVETDFEEVKSTNATESKKKDTKIKELESLLETSAKSADDARTNWQKDTETLSRDLQRTQSTLNRADDYAVNVEREAAVDRATLKSLEEQANTLSTENSKLREALILEKSSSQAQIETLERTITQLRNDYNEAQENFASEQKSKNAIERRLVSIEKSYEELRKSVDEGAVAVTQAYETDTSALAKKYRDLENASNQASAQYQDDIAALKKQIAVLEKERENADKETSAKADAVAQLTADNRDLKTIIQNLENAHRKGVESLRMDVQDLTHTCATEREKNEQDTQRFEAEIEQLKLRLNESTHARRKIENDLSRISSEAASAKAKAEILAESEQKLDEERSQLVQETSTLRADLTAAETKSTLLNKRVLELEKNLSSANQERTRALGSTQSQLQARDDEIAALAKQLSEIETQNRELDDRVRLLESELANTEQRNQLMVDEMRKLQRQNEEELVKERDEAFALARAAEERRQSQDAEMSDLQRKERDSFNAKENEFREALRASDAQLASYRSQLETAEAALQEWKVAATRARAEAEDTEARTSEQAINDRNRIAKLEAAVAKGAEVEELLEEQVAGYKIEAQRAREQMLLVTRETQHLREELQATATSQRMTQEENLRLLDRVQALEGESRTSTTVAVKRLSLENEDLRNKVQQLQLRLKDEQNRNNNTSRSSSPSRGAGAGGFARIQQLENENDVLHGRIATLDAERNAAWKELQQLLDDHKVLHRQFTELKQNQQHHGTTTTASSEIAILRQQQQASRYGGGTPQRAIMAPPSSSSSQQRQSGTTTATRGAALASHYSELLGGIKEMSALLRHYSTFNNTETLAIDPKTIAQIKDWLNTASVRGDAVANTLFTDEERDRLAVANNNTGSTTRSNSIGGIGVPYIK